MNFIKQTDQNELARALSDKIKAALQNDNRVIWLVPGGSNIRLSAAAMKQISEQESERLTIMQTDERYGPLDHPDSNWRQLREAGFATKQARTVPVLTAENNSLAATAANYAAQIEKEFAMADYIIGQFGMGADGHIAGMLPGSPAAKSDKLFTGYDAGQFQRLTMTLPAIRRIAAAYAFIFGAEKQPALDNLHTKALPLVEQPAQILKQVPSASIYNDYIDDAR